MPYHSFHRGDTPVQYINPGSNNATLFENTRFSNSNQSQRLINVNIGGLNRGPIHYLRPHNQSLKPGKEDANKRISALLGESRVVIKDGKREGGSTESLKSNDIIVIDEFNDQELCQNE